MKEMKDAEQNERRYTLKEWEACCLLQHMTEFDAVTLGKMITAAGSAAEVLELRGSELYRLGITPGFEMQAAFDRIRDARVQEEAFLYMREKEIRYVSFTDEAYPERLLEIPDTPIGLFYRGILPENGVPKAAIIGSRRCSAYGKEMAHFFGAELAKRGVQVISGMALGVDGFAMRGARSADMNTWGVLGGGADVCYPMENVGLYRELILGNGGILSERPPGYTARNYDFPIRNRIISGMADVVLVIEAAEHSGSLITVNLALRDQREVFVLPGRVGDRASAGCNELIKNGAQVLTCPEDVLQYLGLHVEKETLCHTKNTLTKEQQAVFELMTSDGTSMDELLERTGFPVGMLTEVLVQLEILGEIRKEGLGGYRRVHR